ncbi:MAG: ABC transporter ATP-binding protein [Oscillospiraceae bacterium]|jgi:branched-chain amino acid transport system ATP-binding protein
MLSIKNINVYYGQIHAIQDLSLEVGDGEIVTLIGANGAGKSTTLKTVSGLLRTKTGSIVLDGKDITKTAPDAIVGMGVAHVPEGRRIFLNMTVAENLEMGSFLERKGIPERAEEVFELFPRLKERRKQTAGTLSGGEQQMLAIGRALMISPRLMMLDEPSMGLAPILVEEIFQIIRDLNSKGITILLVEQNARMALKIASRGYVMESGRIVLSDDASKLLNDESVKKAYLGMAD